MVDGSALGSDEGASFVLGACETEGLAEGSLEGADDGSLLGDIDGSEDKLGVEDGMYFSVGI